MPAVQGRSLALLPNLQSRHRQAFGTSLRLFMVFSKLATSQIRSKALGATEKKLNGRREHLILLESIGCFLQASYFRQLKPAPMFISRLQTRYTSASSAHPGNVFVKNLVGLIVGPKGYSKGGFQVPESFRELPVSTIRRAETGILSADVKATLTMSAERPMKRTSSLVKRQKEEEDRSLRTRLTESPADQEASSLPPAYPLTDEKKAGPQRPGRFKAVSQLVVAMNRFKGGLPNSELASLSTQLPSLPSF